MTTKNQEITQEESSKKIVYPVTIELSENFLTKNPTIKDLYKDGKLNMQMSPYVDKEFAKSLTSIMGDLNPREIVLFNPLVDAVNELAELDSVIGTAKPERTKDDDDDAYAKKLKAWDKENDLILKSNNGKIRSFNGSLTNSKKEIKEPYTSISKKIDALYNSFKGFSDKRKENVEKNFDELLTWRAEEAQKVADEAKRIELENIRNLEAKNEEANEKLKTSEKKNMFADALTEILDYHTDFQKKLRASNALGIEALEKEHLEKQFTYNTDDFEESQIESLKQNAAVYSKASDDLIKELKQSLEESKTETMPVLPPNIKKGNDDSALFGSIIFRLGVVFDQINLIDSKFTDPKLKPVDTKLKTQLEKLKENVNLIKAYVEKKNETYINLKK